MGVYARQLRPRLLDATLADSRTAHLRSRVCADLSGDVLEIGFGSGLNLPHLPPAVRRVLAVEPSDVAVRLSGPRRAATAVQVDLVGDDAQALALPDGSVDAALSTWNLCGIDDPVAALREVRRVLRPGGSLHFVEHGLAPDRSVARWQRRGNRLNRWVAGCVLDRDVVALLATSGLTVSALRTGYEPKAPRTAGFFFEGRATA